MRRIVFILGLIISTMTLCVAQNAKDVMSLVVSKYTKARNVSASFSLISPQFNAKGTIVMSGNKFRIISNDYKCWYDGKTQWVYSTVTGEVNIIEPTYEDLETSNPYAAIAEYQSNYNESLKAKTISSYLINLKAKKKDAYITNLLLTIAKSSNRITKADVSMSDGSSQTLIFSNYKNDDNSVSDATFKFDKSLVPTGTAVVDLR